MRNSLSTSERTEFVRVLITLDHSGTSTQQTLCYTEGLDYMGSYSCKKITGY